MSLDGSIAQHHTLMPVGFSDYHTRKQLVGAEAGVFLSSAHGIPHLRLPVKSRRHHDAPDFNPIYDIEADPTQESPLRDGDLEEQLAGKMKELLERFDAPECQYARVGLVDG